MNDPALAPDFLILFPCSMNFSATPHCIPPVESNTLGVGHNPDSLPKMGGADIGRGTHAPFRIVPERGQVSENDSKLSPKKEAWDVFHEDETGSHFTQDSGVLSPETTSCSTINPGAFS
jgi:hypothetical protein